MAFGFFKKLVEGVKKGFNWVKDKVVKPVVKFAAPIVSKVANMAAPVLDVVAPEFGLAAHGIGLAADTVGGLFGANGSGQQQPDPQPDPQPAPQPTQFDYGNQYGQQLGGATYQGQQQLGGMTYQGNQGQQLGGMTYQPQAESYNPDGYGPYQRTSMQRPISGMTRRGRPRRIAYQEPQYGYE